MKTVAIFTRRLNTPNETMSFNDRKQFIIIHLAAFSHSAPLKADK